MSHADQDRPAGVCSCEWDLSLVEHAVGGAAAGCDRYPPFGAADTLCHTVGEAGMLLLWSTGLLSLVALTAAHAIPQPSATAQQPASAARQPSTAAPPLSAAEQLSALLGPAVEAAVLRALAAERAAQQQCAADAGQRALGRLEQRLDILTRDVTALQTALDAVQGGVTPARGGDTKQERSESPPDPRTEQEPEPESEPKTEPVCDPQPAPLPAGSASHREPERRACARSCLQLRNQASSPQDGVYWFTGMPVPVFCDFSHDDGGWTLLLSAVSQHGWDPFSVLARNRLSPSLTDNYSILQYADAIRDLGTSDRFAYRIETQAETGRRRWGGIWFRSSTVQLRGRDGYPDGNRLGQAV